MNGRQKFLTAFLAGLAAPASLYVPSISYRPLINDLTFAEPFALVGYFLSQAFAAENERLGTANPTDLQLSLDLWPTATGPGID